MATVRSIPVTFAVISPKHFPQGRHRNSGTICPCQKRSIVCPLRSALPITLGEYIGKSSVIRIMYIFFSERIILSIYVYTPSKPFSSLEYQIVFCNQPSDDIFVFLSVVLRFLSVFVILYSSTAPYKKTSKTDFSSLLEVSFLDCTL